MSQSWSSHRRPNGYEFTDDELTRRACSTPAGGRVHLRSALKPERQTSCGRLVEMAAGDVVLAKGWPECKTCFAWARGGTLA